MTAILEIVAIYIKYEKWCSIDRCCEINGLHRNVEQCTPYQFLRHVVDWGYD